MSKYREEEVQGFVTVSAMVSVLKSSTRWRTPCVMVNLREPLSALR
jgi:hypothetical protein